MPYSYNSWIQHNSSLYNVLGKRFSIHVSDNNMSCYMVHPYKYGIQVINITVIFIAM